MSAKVYSFLFQVQIASTWCHFQRHKKFDSIIASLDYTIGIVNYELKYNHKATNKKNVYGKSTYSCSNFFPQFPCTNHVIRSITCIKWTIRAILLWWTDVKRKCIVNYTNAGDITFRLKCPTWTLNNNKIAHIWGFYSLL